MKCPAGTGYVVLTCQVIHIEASRCLTWRRKSSASPIRCFAQSSLSDAIICSRKTLKAFDKRPGLNQRPFDLWFMPEARYFSDYDIRQTIANCESYDLQFADSQADFDVWEKELCFAESD